MIAALLLVAPADAHITLTFPDGRFGDDDLQKSAPCGRGGAQDQRGPNVQTFLPGETIDITWVETINHDSHFRVAFDEDGQDFTTPPEEDSFYVDELVVLDDIQDDPSFSYSVEYTFPLIECSNCTLQVIQVMYEAGPYNPATDVYYQCSDIELAYAVEPGDTNDTGDTDTDVPVDTDTDAPPSDTDDTEPPANTDDPGGDVEGDDEGGCFGGCAGVGAPVSGLAAFLAILAGIGRRRFRR
jgi:hypothetical protein